MKSAALTVLFLIAFGLTATLCEGRVAGTAERCLCQKKTREMVRPALVKTFDIFPPSASCSDTEIILTLKQEMKVCLDPHGTQGQKLLSGQKLQKKPKRQRSNKEKYKQKY